MNSHVLQVLTEATTSSTSKLEELINKEDGAVVSSHKEAVCIAGVNKVIRRVFVDIPTAAEYATIGWVMNEDMDQCMTCLKPFWFFQARKHCHACGNINCSDCAGSFCLVEELPDQTHGVPVCSFCYWGQEPVAGWHRQGGVDLDVKSSKVVAAASGQGSEDGSDISTRNRNMSNIDKMKAEMMLTQKDRPVSPTNKENTNGKSDSPESSQETKNKESLVDLRKKYGSSHKVDSKHRASPNTPNSTVFVDKTEERDNDCISSDDEDFLSLQTPTPLFVIKTKTNRSTKAKVFVNVCTLKEVDLVTAVGAKRGLFLNGKIPVESTDKSGETCLIFDVYVNTIPSSAKHYDMDAVNDWIQPVGGEIIKLINTDCNESLDLTLKFPKTKGNYKGEVIKPFKSLKKRPSGAPGHYGLGSKIPPPKKGWMKKQRRGGLIKNWKDRYFVLSGGELRYYEDSLDTPPYGELEKGCMDLTGAEVEDPAALQLRVVGQEGLEKDLLLEAEDASTKREWMNALKHHIAYLAAP